MYANLWANRDHSLGNQEFQARYINKKALNYFGTSSELAQEKLSNMFDADRVL